MLKIENLEKRFGSLCVLDDFSIQVPDNRFVVLIGPSGCGKSTLFDLLTGVVPLDSGNIIWRETAVAHLGGRAAYMQQNDLLLPWMSLFENSLLPARIQGKDIVEARSRVSGLLRSLGLTGFERFLPAQVSGGMRQRCALVRTLMFEHDLVLLDEPLSALDAITRRSLQILLLLLQTEFRKTILMITHDVEEALLLADDLYILGGSPMRVRRRLSPKSRKPRSFTDPVLVELKDHVLAQLEREL